FKRKSVRKYELVSLEEETIENISVYMDVLKPVYENINIEMKIVTHNVVRSLLPVKASYYILFFSEEKAAKNSPDGYYYIASLMVKNSDCTSGKNLC
ncbi:MAG: nitroreductase family protein, partial [Halanaerobiales bacterium]